MITRWPYITEYQAYAPETPLGCVCVCVHVCLCVCVLCVCV